MYKIDWENNRLLEMSAKLPEGFSFDTLLQYNTFGDRLAYVHNHFVRTAPAGSSRIAYDMPEEGSNTPVYVIKVAKNERGIAQNKAEKEVSSKNLVCCAPVRATSEEDIYLEMMYAEYEEDMIKNISYWLGESFLTLIIHISHYKKDLVTDLIDYLEDDDSPEGKLKVQWVKDLVTLIQKFSMAIGDLRHDEHYGFITNEQGIRYPVVIDYGFTKDIAWKMYGVDPQGTTQPEGPLTVEQKPRKTVTKTDYGQTIKWELYNGELQSPDNDTPALEIQGKDRKTKAWYRNGMLHRDDDKPARVIEDLTSDKVQMEYYDDGLLHRDKGLPAVILIKDGKVASRRYYDQGQEQFT